MPDKDDLRHPGKGVVDQRQQQIDPAGKHRRDEDRRPDTNTKQPGNLPADGPPSAQPPHVEDEP